MKTITVHWGVVAGPLLLAFVLALLLAAGCGSARRSEPIIGAQPPANDDIEQGKLGFDLHCNGCHPGGEAGLGPALNDKPLSRGFIEYQIRRGLGAMPAFSERVIGDEQRRQIASYLVWLRRRP